MFYLRCLLLNLYIVLLYDRRWVRISTVSIVSVTFSLVIPALAEDLPRRVSIWIRPDISPVPAEFQPALPSEALSGFRRPRPTPIFPAPTTTTSRERTADGGARLPARDSPSGAVRVPTRAPGSPLPPPRPETVPPCTTPEPEVTLNTSSSITSAAAEREEVFYRRIHFTTTSTSAGWLPQPGSVRTSPAITTQEHTTTTSPRPPISRMPCPTSTIPRRAPSFIPTSSKQRPPLRRSAPSRIPVPVCYSLHYCMFSFLRAGCQDGT